MKNIIKRPLSPGEKQDMALFWGSLQKVYDMTFDSFYYDSEETEKTVNTLVSLLYPNCKLPKVLCLWGENSVGKTHLFRAIENKSCQNVLYTTSDQLSQELTRAIQKDDVSIFKNTFGNVDILLVDDAQFFVAREAMLDFLYNEIVPLIHQNIILASDCDPKNIGILRGDSKVLRIEAPSLEVRRKILRQRMTDLHLTLDDEMQYRISSSLTDPRKINGFLTYLKATQTGKP